MEQLNIYVIFILLQIIARRYVNSPNFWVTPPYAEMRKLDFPSKKKKIITKVCDRLLRNFHDDYFFLLSFQYLERFHSRYNKGHSCDIARDTTAIVLLQERDTAHPEHPSTLSGAVV